MEKHARTDMSFRSPREYEHQQLSAHLGSGYHNKYNMHLAGLAKIKKIHNELHDRGTK